MAANPNEQKEALEEERVRELEQAVNQGQGEQDLLNILQGLGDHPDAVVIRILNLMNAKIDEFERGRVSIAQNIIEDIARMNNEIEERNQQQNANDVNENQHGVINDVDGDERQNELQDQDEQRQQNAHNVNENQKEVEEERERELEQAVEAAQNEQALSNVLADLRNQPDGGLTSRANRILASNVLDRMTARMAVLEQQDGVQFSEDLTQAMAELRNQIRVENEEEEALLRLVNGQANVQELTRAAREGEREVLGAIVALNNAASQNSAVLTALVNNRAVDAAMLTYAATHGNLRVLEAVVTSNHALEATFIAIIGNQASTENILQAIEVIQARAVVNAAQVTVAVTNAIAVRREDFDQAALLNGGTLERRLREIALRTQREQTLVDTAGHGNALEATFLAIINNRASTINVLRAIEAIGNGHAANAREVTAAIANALHNAIAAGHDVARDTLALGSANLAAADIETISGRTVLAGDFNLIAGHANANANALHNAIAAGHDVARDTLALGSANLAAADIETISGRTVLAGDFNLIAGHANANANALHNAIAAGHDVARDTAALGSANLAAVDLIVVAGRANHAQLVAIRNHANFEVDPRIGMLCNFRETSLDIDAIMDNATGHARLTAIAAHATRLQLAAIRNHANFQGAPGVAVACDLREKVLDDAEIADNATGHVRLTAIAPHATRAQLAAIRVHANFQRDPGVAVACNARAIELDLADNATGHARLTLIARYATQAQLAVIRAHVNFGTNPNVAIACNLRQVALDDAEIANNATVHDRLTSIAAHATREQLAAIRNHVNFQGDPGVAVACRARAIELELADNATGHVRLTAIAPHATRAQLAVIRGHANFQGAPGVAVACHAREVVLDAAAIANNATPHETLTAIVPHANRLQLAAIRGHANFQGDPRVAVACNARAIELDLADNATGHVRLTAIALHATRAQLAAIRGHANFQGDQGVAVACDARAIELELADNATGHVRLTAIAAHATRAQLAVIRSHANFEADPGVATACNLQEVALDDAAIANNATPHGTLTAIAPRATQVQLAAIRGHANFQRDQGVAVACDARAIELELADNATGHVRLTAIAVHATRAQLAVIRGHANFQGAPGVAVACHAREVVLDAAAIANNATAHGILTAIAPRATRAQLATIRGHANFQQGVGVACDLREKVLDDAEIADNATVHGRLTIIAARATRLQLAAIRGHANFQGDQGVAVACDARAIELELADNATGHVRLTAIAVHATRAQLAVIRSHANFEADPGVATACNLQEVALDDAAIANNATPHGTLTAIAPRATQVQLAAIRGHANFQRDQGVAVACDARAIELELADNATGHVRLTAIAVHATRAQLAVIRGHANFQGAPGVAVACHAREVVLDAAAIANNATAHGILTAIAPRATRAQLATIRGHANFQQGVGVACDLREKVLDDAEIADNATVHGRLTIIAARATRLQLAAIRGHANFLADPGVAVACNVREIELDLADNATGHARLTLIARYATQAQLAVIRGHVNFGADPDVAITCNLRKVALDDAEIANNATAYSRLTIIAARAIRVQLAAIRNHVNFGMDPGVAVACNAREKELQDEEELLGTAVDAFRKLRDSACPETNNVIRRMSAAQNSTEGLRIMQQYVNEFGGKDPLVAPAFKAYKLEAAKKVDDVNQRALNRLTPEDIEAMMRENNSTAIESFVSRY